MNLSNHERLTLILAEALQELLITSNLELKRKIFLASFIETNAKMFEDYAKRDISKENKDESA